MKRQILSIAMAVIAISILTQCKSSSKSQSQQKVAVVNPLALHRTVAIIPGNINVSLSSKGSANITAEQLLSARETSAYSLQEKFYNLFIMYAKKGDYYVSCQSIYTTNSKLKNAGIKYEDLYSIDRTELAKMLGVDAIIQLSTSSEQFMSDGAAIVRSFLLMSSKNKVASSLISIVDGKSGNTTWNYEAKIKGKKSSSKLVDDVLKTCAARIPYTPRMLKKNNQII